MKKKIITQTGIIVSGVARIAFWGNGTGKVIMNEYFLPNKFITPKNILRCVNDGSYGCQCILSADIDIYIKYDNGTKVYDRTFWDVNRPQFTQFFLGWGYLKEIGAIK